MAKYRASIATPRPPEEVFAYLSDFSNTLEWDPGVVEAERLDDAPLCEGSEFRIVANFLGRRNALIYRILEFDAPNMVTFRGASGTVVSLDRIALESFGSGTKVTYDAELTLKGPFKLADALLAVAFRRVGDRAVAGLRETLAQDHARAPAL